MSSRARAITSSVRGGGGGHLVFQGVQDFAVAASQEGEHPVYRAAVFLVGALSAAGPKAPADLIIDAGALGLFQGEDGGTGPQGEYPSHGLQHIPDRSGADVGAEIPGAVLFKTAAHFRFGVGVPEVHPDIGIVLVVLEKDVVIGPVQLDQVAFQDQRLQVGAAQEDIEIVDMAHHGLHLGGVGG